MLYSEPPYLIHLKVFGSLSYATTLQAHRIKFSPRARKSIFFGIKDGTKGYILYDLKSHSVFVSRNVIFYKGHFPCKSHTKPIVTNTSDIPTNVPIYDDLDVPHTPTTTTDISLSLDSRNFDSQPVTNQPIPPFQK